jgi:hypothetical protein
MLDWMERQREKAIARGFEWNSFDYDALDSKLSIREQISAAMKADGAIGLVVKETK